MGSASSLSSNKTKNNKEITKNFNIKSGKISPIDSNKQKLINNNKSDIRAKNLEPYTLICLDEHFNENDKQIRSIIDFVYSFDYLDKCEKFILNTNQFNWIFFIVSNEHFPNIISHIHDLPQLNAVYVYQQKKLNYQKNDFIDKHWTKRYSKLKGVYFDRETLFEQLSSDVKICTNLSDLIPISVYSRLDAIQPTNNSTDHLRFLFYQLFVHQYCLNNSSSTSTKDEFVDLIKEYYQKNRSQLKLIDQFDNEFDSSKNVLSWILHETFIQRILTKSLLTLDIQILFSMKFLIKHFHQIMIEKALIINSNKTNNSRRYVNGRTNQEQIYYRGQALSKETFLKIKSNIGEILSMNNFVLASENRQDSLGYLRQNVSTTDLIYRVLFEMKIPYDYTLQKQRPFVDISYLNDQKNKLSNSDDDENNKIYSILFFIGSIFRITTVVFDINNDCWIIQLTLYDEGLNQDFTQLFSYIYDNKQSNTESMLTLATLLRQISPNSAELFYEYLLKDNSKLLSKFECYHGLGLCLYSQDNYDQALDYFEKALDLKPNDKLIKSSLHHNLGLVYAQQNQIDNALNHFNKALEYCSMPTHIACVHHNLALIYSKQGLYQQELKHYEKALQIRTNQYPTSQLQLASLYNNIGIAYTDIHQYDQALTNLRKALDIRLKLLSDNHIDIARSYANIGTFYAKTQEYRMALEYFNKAQLLFEQQTNIPQIDIQQLERNIKFVNDKLRRKTY